MTDKSAQWIADLHKKPVDDNPVSQDLAISHSINGACSWAKSLCRRQEWHTICARKNSKLEISFKDSEPSDEDPRKVNSGDKNLHMATMAGAPGEAMGAQAHFPNSPVGGDGGGSVHIRNERFG
jgi:hypothetical protein